MELKNIEFYFHTFELIFMTKYRDQNKRAFMDGLGNKIRILRYRKGWSQEMLAQKLGISIFVLSQIENDEVDLFYNLVVKISDLFNIPLAVLLAVDNDEVRIAPTEEENLESQIKSYNDYIIELKEKYKILKERLKK